ncbi:MAG: pantetheine-phosphate adenylyltransferase [Betaproteobacteria bacterium]
MVREKPPESPTARAAYPGTFDPFTTGHLDVAERARRLFDHLVILVAVNAAKSPGRNVVERADVIRAVLPAAWNNVTVAAWSGLTVDYCRLNTVGVIIRGVRSAADACHEYELAATNQMLGVTTLFVPARPELAVVSSTAARIIEAHEPSGVPARYVVGT